MLRFEFPLEGDGRTKIFERLLSESSERLRAERGRASERDEAKH